MAARFQNPTGTRDFYPADLLKRRYIERLWRDVSIRHGFEEIDGPTFEHLDLYTVKSGEGIVSELFSFKRFGGEKDFALRPEFTPTLARMYAARANALPKPTKWFSIGPYFRAERPQRGRLREFLQWNADVIGDESEAADVEILFLVVDLLATAGQLPEQVSVRVGDRVAAARALFSCGLSLNREVEGLQFLDRLPKLARAETEKQAKELGIDLERLRTRVFTTIERAFSGGGVEGANGETYWGYQLPSLPEHVLPDVLRGIPLARLAAIDRAINNDLDASAWLRIDLSIARGLAYYTGTVFEAIAAGERAIAGGGRYDNLIELFGGPPTPAVGFAMGDVVLSLVIEDHGLMPSEAELLDILSRPTASLRPDAFVIAANDEAEPHVKPLVASLRRGVESEAWKLRENRKPWDADRYSVPPLHARRSYKSTRNLGKLLKDAASQHARFAVIIESAEEATLKNLATQEQTRVSRADAARRIAELVKPVPAPRSPR